MQTTQIAVDLAKSVFEVAVSHEPGRVADHRRLTRTGFRRFLERQPPCEILMEACGTAHYWGRECRSLGHSVRLLPAGDVWRYRDGNKTDRTDTYALLEASRNGRIDPVPVKSEQHQAIAARHRIRSGYLQTRIARINAIPRPSLGVWCHDPGRRSTRRPDCAGGPRGRRGARTPSRGPGRTTRRHRAAGGPGEGNREAAQAAESRASRHRTPDDGARHRAPHCHRALRVRRRHSSLLVVPELRRLSRAHPQRAQLRTRPTHGENHQTGEQLFCACS